LGYFFERQSLQGSNSSNHNVHTGVIASHEASIHQHLTVAANMATMTMTSRVSPTRLIPPSVSTHHCHYQGMVSAHAPSQPTVTAAAAVTIAPTALMIMRRRGSNSVGDNNSGSHNTTSSNSNSGNSQQQRKKDDLIMSTKSNSSAKQQQQQMSPKSVPEGSRSPETSAPAMTVLHNDDALLLNNNSSAIHHQQSPANNVVLGSPNGSMSHATATTAQQRFHQLQQQQQQVAFELVARDRARLEAEYYSSSGGYNNGHYAGTMDYGYDYYGNGSSGMDNIGGHYYGASPSFRGMQQQQQGMTMDHQFYQPRMIQRQSYTAQQAVSQQQQVNTHQGQRVYREVDYKNDRVWQEDDHSFRPEQQRSIRTDNTVVGNCNHHHHGENDYLQDDGSAEENNGVVPNNNHQAGRNQALRGRPLMNPNQQTQPLPTTNMMPQRVSQTESRLSIDDHDIPSGTSPYYHPHHRQASPPPLSSTSPNNGPHLRVRQNSDISSVAVESSVGGNSHNGGPRNPNMSIHNPIIGATPIMHPRYGLIYPPGTPTGSVCSMPPPHLQPPPMAQVGGVYHNNAHHHHHADVRQGGGGAWVDPHHQLQLQLQASTSTMPHSAHAVVNKSVQDAATAEDNKPARSNKSSMKTFSRTNNNNTHPPTLSSSAPPRLPSSSNNKPTNNNSTKHVTFSHLHIRTYETILGDNPSCSGGPSLGLGWRYDPSPNTVHVNDYEAAQARLHGIIGPDGQLVAYECRPEDLVLHRFEREAILLNTGYARQDLADSVRALNKAKNKRRQTVHNLPAAFVEERVEVVKRTLRRWMLKKERTRWMYEDWKRRSIVEEGRENSQK